MVLDDVAAGSNYTAPGNPCSPGGSESAFSCLTARGHNREGQSGCWNVQFWIFVWFRCTVPFPKAP